MMFSGALESSESMSCLPGMKMGSLELSLSVRSSSTAPSVAWPASVARDKKAIFFLLKHLCTYQENLKTHGFYLDQIQNPNSVARENVRELSIQQESLLGTVSVVVRCECLSVCGHECVCSVCVCGEGR